jgi:hypothetical protein
MESRCWLVWICLPTDGLRLPTFFRQTLHFLFCQMGILTRFWSLRSRLCCLRRCSKCQRSHRRQSSSRSWCGRSILRCHAHHLPQCASYLQWSDRWHVWYRLSDGTPPRRSFHGPRVVEMGKKSSSDVNATRGTDLNSVFLHQPSPRGRDHRLHPVLL